MSGVTGATEKHFKMEHRGPSGWFIDGRWTRNVREWRTRQHAYRSRGAHQRHCRTTLRDSIQKTTNVDDKCRTKLSNVDWTTRGLSSAVGADGLTDDVDMTRALRENALCYIM